MKTVVLKSLSVSQVKKLTKRPTINLERMFPRVRKILTEVKHQGDVAVRKYTEKFDRVDLGKFQVGEKELKAAASNVRLETKKALKIAAANIEKFHKSQLKKEKPVETTKGIKCWREIKAIEKVGIYIPRGLVSTVLMLGIPAKVAGCQNVIMCTPSDKTGKVAAEMLLAAKIAGIKKVFKIGGVQAIGAMAYGTKTVPKVDKIFGPGNQYVTAAKMLVSIDPEGSAIDLPAGPSEVLVITDERANPSFVAADLLSQAEHGVDSQVVLVTNSKSLADKVKKELKKQLVELPEERRKFASNTLKNSLCIIVNSLAQAIAFANLYAPEHLILNLKNAKKYVAQIKNAGSVFVGEYSPESVGDYASGTNHVLPTSGYAKSYSGVSIDSFIKKITFQKISKTGLQNITKTVKTLAEVENMQAHKNAVLIRLAQ